MPLLSFDCYLAANTDKMIPPGPAFHKPKSFIAAKNLLYASLFISAIAVFLRDSSIGLANNGGVQALLLTAVGYGIVIFLIKQMSLCRKWARTVLLVLFILILVSYLFMIKAYVTIDFYEGALLVLQFLLQILALIFLYRQESNTWFNSNRIDGLP
jgi:peptidoglycan/LPS O-acetylase OafA/YrhL